MNNIQKFFRNLPNRALQASLNEKGAGLVVDGFWGAKSTAALLRFQQQRGLPTTGKINPETEKALYPTLQEKYLKESDFVNAQKRIGCSMAALLAVFDVETKGIGFLPDGRCLILFERHIFHRELLKIKPRDEVEKLAQANSGIIHPSPGGYQGGTYSWVKLNRAISIDMAAALKSASWGIGQIMGFNHAESGYPDLNFFIANMKRSESHQLEVFIRFIVNHRGRQQALIQNNWAEFARLYNGANYAKNRYDVKLRDSHFFYSH